MSTESEVPQWSWSEKSSHNAESICENYKMFLSMDTIVIEPVDSDRENFLVINRTEKTVDAQKNFPIIDGATQRSIYGVVGFLDLIGGPFLIVIDSREKIAEINGHGIYRIRKFDFIQISTQNKNLTENQVKCNQKYLSMIEQVLKTDAFYYSYSYDISHTFQRLQTSPPEFQTAPLIERADPRFVWNRSLLNVLLKNQRTVQFALPIIHGYVVFETINVNGHSILYGIISRRSTARAGTRLFVRGIDEKGHVANFVETEQIFQSADVACSYVQTRGSIPCYWTQMPNIRYKPKVAVTEGKNHLDAFRRHFEEQEYHYGRQFLISLTNQHGSEGKLNDKYRELHERSKNSALKFEDFDFHKECAGMRYDRLTILMARVLADQDDYGFFAIRKDGILENQQTGVFRTNCIDCLDRTNVVQSLLAKRIFEIQLRQFSIIGNDENLPSYKHLNSIFQNLWADNADFISTQYAGTGALKTDFTRTGKRSTMGLVRDGYNSAARYVLNNFYDGFRQDGIDVFLGNYQVSPDEGRQPKSSPVDKDRKVQNYILPMFVFLSFTIFTFSLFRTSSFGEKSFSVLLWALVSFSSGAIFISRGKKYVNFPKLSYKTKID